MQKVIIPYMDNIYQRKNGSSHALFFIVKYVNVAWCFKKKKYYEKIIVSPIFFRWTDLYVISHNSVATKLPVEIYLFANHIIHGPVLYICNCFRIFFLNIIAVQIIKTRHTESTV